MRRLANTLKLKRFRHKFGIAAPRVVIRSYVPWQWRFALAVVCFLLLLVALVVLVQRNQAGLFGAELEGLRKTVELQRAELDVLRSTAGTGQNAVGIERASQQKLLSRIQSLEAENAALREDVRLFERLVPSVGEAAGVRVESFRVVSEGGGRYRYRLLAVFQPSRQVPEFKGVLRLHADIVRNNRLESLVFPAVGDDMIGYQLEIRHLLRREGWFQLPEEAILRSVEARVMQGEVIRSRSSAQL